MVGRGSVLRVGAARARPGNAGPVQPQRGGAVVIHFRRTASRSQPVHPEMNSRDLTVVAAYFDELVRREVAAYLDDYVSGAASGGDARHAKAYREVAEEYRGHASKAMAREQRILDIVRDMNARRVCTIGRAVTP